MARLSYIGATAPTQQGVRVQMNPRLGSYRRRLRGLGDSSEFIPTSYDPSLYPGTGPIPVAPSCSWWDALWSNCADSETAQIQSVADNAATYYGSGSTVAQVAQQAANQQIAQVPADQSSLNKPPSPPDNSWLWIALTAAAAAFIAGKAL